MWPRPFYCTLLFQAQALIKFKNYFYFEEKDDTVEEAEKVKSGGRVKV